MSGNLVQPVMQIEEQTLSGTLKKNFQFESLLEEFERDLRAQQAVATSA